MQTTKYTRLYVSFVTLGFVFIFLCLLWTVKLFLNPVLRFLRWAQAVKRGGQTSGMRKGSSLTVGEPISRANFRKETPERQPLLRKMS